LTFALFVFCVSLGLLIVILISRLFLLSEQLGLSSSTLEKEQTSPLDFYLRSLTSPIRKRIEHRDKESKSNNFDRAIFDWIDLLQMGAAAGMNLQQAISYTGPLTAQPLRQTLEDIEARSRAGEALIDLLRERFESEGGQAAASVVHLLSDSARRGLPLNSALLTLKGEMFQRRRHMVRSQLKGVGFKIAVGTVLFLFPPTFVLVIVPNLMTFFSW